MSKDFKPKFMKVGILTAALQEPVQTAPDGRGQKTAGASIRAG